jgi:hypothetical protein
MTVKQNRFLDRCTVAFILMCGVLLILSFFEKVMLNSVAGRAWSAMTLDSDQFFDWCVGIIVLAFAAGMLLVAFGAGALP